MKHFPEKRAQGNLGSFFYPGAKNTASLMEKIAQLVERCLTAEVMGPSPILSFLFFYSRLDAKNSFCFMEEMSSEE